MFTVIVAIAHAFRTNDRFTPDLLYLGTFILDFTLINGWLML